MIANEPAGGQVEDRLLRQRRVERPVELVERLDFAEGGRLHATIDQPLVADHQLVLQDQFQELGVAQVVAGGFLQSHVERLGQAREPQLTQGCLERIFHRMVS